MCRMRSFIMSLLVVSILRNISSTDCINSNRSFRNHDQRIFGIHLRQSKYALQMRQKLKYLFPFLLLLAVGCKKGPEQTAKAVINNLNSYDRVKLEGLLDSSFVYENSYDTLTRTEFLDAIDSLKKIGSKRELINLINQDSIIITEERLSDIFLESLDINPKPIQHTKYKIENGKVASIYIDTIIVSKKYLDEFENKIVPFEYFLKDSFGLTSEEALVDINKYLIDYNRLSLSDKKKYKLFANLQGSYLCRDLSASSWLPILIFKGKSSVVVLDVFSLAFIMSEGLNMSSSYIYDIDENYIRIHVKGEVYLFEIIDNNTLQGISSWATGTYRKTNMSLREMCRQIKAPKR